mmetsp:Transcript_25756/g.56806  ORF Transcript_25756/g.56806 Transcript_25756/m.56806 type:complete len:469 (-) Transcript_25756:152-1558(-)
MAFRFVPDDCVAAANGRKVPLYYFDQLAVGTQQELRQRAIALREVKPRLPAFPAHVEGLVDWILEAQSELSGRPKSDFALPREDLRKTLTPDMRPKPPGSIFDKTKQDFLRQQQDRQLWATGALEVPQSAGGVELPMGGSIRDTELVALEMRARRWPMEDVAELVTEAMNMGPREEVWGQWCPSATTEEINRGEHLLRQACQVHPIFQRHAHSNLDGLRAYLNIPLGQTMEVTQDRLVGLGEEMKIQVKPVVLEALFNRYDLEKTGYLLVEELAQNLFRQMGDVEGNGRAAVARMREALTLRPGGFGCLHKIVDFLPYFRKGSPILPRDVFSTLLDSFMARFGTQLSVVEHDALAGAFRAPGHRQIDARGCLLAVRGLMGQARTKAVEGLFQRLAAGAEAVEGHQLAKAYLGGNRPGGSANATSSLMETFPTAGRLTQSDFVEGYHWMSAPVAADPHFFAMLNEQWGM